MSSRSYSESEQARQQDRARAKRERRGAKRCANGPTPDVRAPGAWWVHVNQRDKATKKLLGAGEQRRLERIAAAKKKHAETVQARPAPTERSEQNRRKRARRSSRGYLLTPTAVAESNAS